MRNLCRKYYSKGSQDSSVVGGDKMSSATGALSLVMMPDWSINSDSWFTLDNPHGDFIDTDPFLVYTTFACNMSTLAISESRYQQCATSRVYSSLSKLDLGDLIIDALSSTIGNTSYSSDALVTLE